MKNYTVTVEQAKARPALMNYLAMVIYTGGEDAGRELRARLHVAQVRRRLAAQELADAHPALFLSARRPCAGLPRP